LYATGEIQAHQSRSVTDVTHGPLPVRYHCNSEHSHHVELCPILYCATQSLLTVCGNPLLFALLPATDQQFGTWSLREFKVDWKLTVTKWGETKTISVQMLKHSAW